MVRRKRMTIMEARKIAYAKIGTYSTRKRNQALKILRANFLKKYGKKR